MRNHYFYVWWNKYYGLRYDNYDGTKEEFKEWIRTYFHDCRIFKLLYVEKGNTDGSSTTLWKAKGFSL